MRGQTVTVHIDNGPALAGELLVERTQIDVSTAGPAPDPAWNYVDAAGHWHAWTTDQQLPTLARTAKPQPCDGSCGGVCQGEGYAVNEYTCRLCGEVIVPGSIPGPHERHIDGPAEWQVQVHGVADIGGCREVTVRMVEADTGVTWFGMALLTDLEYRTGDGVTATLHGNGPLGSRYTQRSRVLPRPGA